jgi:hypothetical protein
MTYDRHAQAVASALGGVGGGLGDLSGVIGGHLERRAHAGRRSQRQASTAIHQRVPPGQNGLRCASVSTTR